MARQMRLRQQKKTGHSSGMVKGMPRRGADGMEVRLLDDSAKEAVEEIFITERGGIALGYVNDPFRTPCR